MSSELRWRQDALRLYVASSRQRLQQLLRELQWNEQSVRQLHYATPVAGQLLPSCIAAAEHSIQMDAAQLQQLLGTVAVTTTTTNTFDELQANYSASQKLLIYEHVIKATPTQHQSIEDNAKFAELVAVTKRAHQKQRRYRKSKPTLHEEMHQLVELQMQALQQQLYQQQPNLIQQPHRHKHWEERQTYTHNQLEARQTYRHNQLEERQTYRHKQLEEPQPYRHEHLAEDVQPYRHKYKQLENLDRRHCTRHKQGHAQHREQVNHSSRQHTDSNRSRQRQRSRERHNRSSGQRSSHRSSRSSSHRRSRSSSHRRSRHKKSHYN